MKAWLFLFILISASCDRSSSGTDANTIDAASNRTRDTTVRKPEIAGPVTGTTMPLEYSTTIGRFIYVWAWPMVNIHNRRVAFNQIPINGLLNGIVPAAPVNSLTMLSDYVDPAERVVATPNQDVVYGFGIISLDKEPVVIQVPDFKDRFWVYQVADQRTDGISQLGKMYNTKPGFYLLASEKWKGDIPKEIAGVFRSPTEIGVIAPRVFVTDDPADKLAIQPIINQIMMYPLSNFTGKMQTTNWRKIPNIPGESGSKSETQWVNPQTFFDLLPEVLKEVPPLPGEEAIYQQANALVAAARNDSAILRGLQKMAAETEVILMKNELFEWKNQGIKVQNGWSTMINAAQWGTDYLTRASAAKANIFSNAPKETIYFALDIGPDGKRLHGSNNYTITFDANKLPPVNGFWSLTMYNKEHFFELNEIKRYSVGTKNKTLRYNSDSSLTIYMSPVKPKDSIKLANWLPSPKKEFSLYVRAYWPKEEIQSRQWAPPAVKKVE